MSKYTIETIGTINSGKMQMNAKSGKNFRTTLAKWHNADFELAEEILRKTDRVNAKKVLIASNEELIAKLEKGESIIGGKSMEELQAEIDTWNAEIDAENNALAEYRKEQAERYADAHALLSKDLHKAYVGYVTEGKRDEYVVALANFFADNGLEPTIDSLNVFVGAVGKKKNSARQKIKTGNHNGAVSYVAWRDVFLGEICDVMGDALPLYRFTYVLKENRDK